MEPESGQLATVPAPAAAAVRKPPIIAPKPGVVHVFRALYDYNAEQEDELSFSEGDILYVTEGSDKDWLKARCGTKQGLIPANYVEQKLDSLENPIHDAARRGNLAVLTELLENRVSPGSLDSAGNTGLHWAARGGHIECCQILLKHSTGVQKFVDVKNKLGETALHLAAYKGHLPIVNLLLASGANPTIKNLSYQKPVDLAEEADIKLVLRQSELSVNDQADAGHGEDYEFSDEDEDEGAVEVE